MKRVHLFILGQVQGIGFRSFIKWKAKKLGLTGWVKNLEDGRVEAVFEGDEERLREIIKACREGPPLSQVEDVKIFWKEAEGKFVEFEIR